MPWGLIKLTKRCELNYVVVFANHHILCEYVASKPFFNQTNKFFIVFIQNMILECMGGNILMDVKNTYASLNTQYKWRCSLNLNNNSYIHCNNVWFLTIYTKLYNNVFQITDRPMNQELCDKLNMLLIISLVWEIVYL
jgi:hypothetical protein